MSIGSLRPVSSPDLAMAGPTKTDPRPGFAEHLKAAIGTANNLQNQSNNAQVELATGRNGNIHETLIAMNKASVSFQMLLQVRNKVVSAYQEVMRMHI